ncbi:MAG: glycoside hydrolase family 88 protein [candidate division KSB1 bacterium]|nr:glycoside hydrolase family 88 protein [candidate division KSB1 bacterium]
MKTRQKLYPIMILLLACISAGMYCTPEKKQSPSRGLQWGIRMAESVIVRHPDNYYKWDYVTGTVLRGFEELWLLTGERKYYEYIKKSVDFSVNEDGSINDYDLNDYNIDEINEGRMLLFLYKETGDEKYKKAADLLYQQLIEQPRTSGGGFWHKQRYPFQMWLDGLYMGAPFYAEYGKLFNNPEIYDDVVLQFELSETHTRNAWSGLLYHGWDEKKTQDWADSKTGQSSEFWARGMGWYAMALVDVIEIMPKEYQQRKELMDILARLAKAIKKTQDKDSGVWWQIMNKPEQAGNYLEASASCMFTYALAKGVRKGYLDESYHRIADRGYKGIIDQFVSENSDGTLNLNQICRSAGLGYGRDGSYSYYINEDIVSNDGKGVGPFITASVEIHKLNN